MLEHVGLDVDEAIGGLYAAAKGEALRATARQRTWVTIQPTSSVRMRRMPSLLV